MTRRAFGWPQSISRALVGLRRDAPARGDSIVEHLLSQAAAGDSRATRAALVSSLVRHAEGALRSEGSELWWLMQRSAGAGPVEPTTISRRDEDRATQLAATAEAAEGGVADEAWTDALRTALDAQPTRLLRRAQGNPAAFLRQLLESGEAAAHDDMLLSLRLPCYPATLHDDMLLLSLRRRLQPSLAKRGVKWPEVKRFLVVAPPGTLQELARLEPSFFWPRLQQVCGAGLGLRPTSHTPPQRQHRWHASQNSLRSCSPAPLRRRFSVNPPGRRCCAAWLRDTAYRRRQSTCASSRPCQWSS